MLSLVKWDSISTTSNTCMLYDLRYDDGHLHVLFFLITWHFIN